MGIYQENEANIPKVDVQKTPYGADYVDVTQGKAVKEDKEEAPIANEEKGDALGTIGFNASDIEQAKNEAPETESTSSEEETVEAPADNEGGDAPETTQEDENDATKGENDAPEGDSEVNEGDSEATVAHDETDGGEGTAEANDEAPEAVSDAPEDNAEQARRPGRPRKVKNNEE